MRILQVGTVESGGGAASVMQSLRRGYAERGHEAWLAVGSKTTLDPHVFAIPDDDRPLYRWSGYAALQAGLGQLRGRFPGSGWGMLSRSLRVASHPRVLLTQHQGREDFDFPGTYRLLDLTPTRPDIVHCHNLHGGYFDLRALPWLSRRVPTVLTLHDTWLLSGHCSYSLECERWKTGCGRCPDLTLYPAIRRDATAENWDRKRDIFAQSRLNVATPSRWLLDKVQESMLAPAIVDAMVIPNGVDLAVFQPGDKPAVRASLGIPPAARVVLLTAGSEGSAWKDHETLHAATRCIAEKMSGPNTVFVVFGAKATKLDGLPAVVRFVGYQRDPSAVARWLQAADIYVHASRADTFPNMVLESMACGTPVVATDVGGIPEQIRPVPAAAVLAGHVGDATGMLTPPSDAEAIVEAVIVLLANDAARERLGDQAASDVRARFALERQVDAYLAWYREILSRVGEPRTVAAV